jgi:N-acetylglucosaminyl-diphospho-decaprenol L-rhamnosyltransferase
VKLSYCVVNTDGRDDLIACLEAIAGTHPGGVEAEVLVLDNASGAGSAAAARAWAARAGALGASARVIERDRRAGKSENDSLLLREAAGEYCLLLNEDAELQPGATATLLDTLERKPGAAAAGALLLAPDGTPLHCAWRLPGWVTVLGGALFLHRLLTTESGGTETREVGWAQSSALLVRRAAAVEVGFLDPAFFVYSDETDFCKRLHDAGWSILHVPEARAIHHEQLATDLRASERRIVEFHRGRDLYLRKHHSAALAALARVLTAWTYLPRTVAALVLPGHDPRRYWLHARKALRPWSSPGMREAAEVYNRRLLASRG